MLTLTRKAPLVISRLETKNVNLSEEWTGAMRFQILRTRHLGGYKWVERRPTLVEESSVDMMSGPKLGLNVPRIKKEKLQNGRK